MKTKNIKLRNEQVEIYDRFVEYVKKKHYGGKYGVISNEITKALELYMQQHSHGFGEKKKRNWKT